MYCIWPARVMADIISDKKHNYFSGSTGIDVCMIQLVESALCMRNLTLNNGSWLAPNGSKSSGS